MVISTVRSSTSLAIPFFSAQIYIILSPWETFFGLGFSEDSGFEGSYDTFFSYPFILCCFRFVYMILSLTMRRWSIVETSRRIYVQYFLLSDIIE